MIFSLPDNKEKSLPPSMTFSGLFLGAIFVTPGGGTSMRFSKFLVDAHLVAALSARLLLAISRLDPVLPFKLRFL